MNTNTKLFKVLHHQEEPFLLGNVWNVQSAKVLEKLNFQAIGTSSAAVAETLGYKDGQFMPFAEYFFIIRRIKESTQIPLTVDLEAGYGKDENEIVENIKRLYDLGVAGINIEDSVVTDSGRQILDSILFGKRLSTITSSLKNQNIDIFINVRCDAFLLKLPEARTEALKRILVYEKNGADGIFLPVITDIEDIKATVSATRLPVNVMCMPLLPDFNILKSLGVRRISMGNFVNSTLYKKLEEMTTHVLQDKSFASVFA
jgi:2-methylisocitrate lyase-like PEP mutase family enzyme